MAATYDTKPWQQKMSAQILPFLRENSDIVLPKTPSPTANDTEKGFKLLDYACGTGLITKVCLLNFLLQHGRYRIPHDKCQKLPYTLHGRLGMFFKEPRARDSPLTSH